jgi:hypothetical protein
MTPNYYGEKILEKEKTKDDHQQSVGGDKGHKLLSDQEGQEKEINKTFIDKEKIEHVCSLPANRIDVGE